MYKWIALLAVLQAAAGLRFSTEGGDLTVLQGESMSLECGLLDEGEDPVPVTWIFQDAAGKTFTVSFGNNIFRWVDVLEMDNQARDGAARRTLVASSVSLDMEGSFQCQVAGTDLTLVYKVVVNVAPIVNLIPSRDSVEVNMGDDLRLHCDATGKPLPDITWGRLTPAVEFPGGALSVAGPDLDILDMGMRDGGSYECTASNGAGTPVTKAIDVVVTYAPSVTVAEEAIHTGPNDDVEITCNFTASPDVKVQWFHNGSVITASNVVSEDTNGMYHDLHSIRINALRPADLGVYKCLGTNKLDSAAQEVTLTAHPHNLAVTSGERGLYSDEYTLLGEVISKPDLIGFDYRVMVKEAEQNATGEAVVANGFVKAAGREAAKHRLNMVIKGLAANVTYAVELRAKNDFGETQWLDFEFLTADAGHEAPLPTTAAPTTQPLPSTTQRVDVETKAAAGGDYNIGAASEDPNAGAGVAASLVSTLAGLVLVLCCL